MARASKHLGERAIVIGGGIAGSLAARVLSEHYEQVVVLERDGEPDADGFRKGTPQAKLVHAILRAGLDTMDALFPGFEAELIERGAVPCKTARDIVLVDGLGEWPRHDVGPTVPLMSRALLERTLHARRAQLPNVVVRPHVVAQELLAEGERVRGVSIRTAAGEVEHVSGDFVVDATGRGAHTRAWLERIGFEPPSETRVEVDIGYACCFVRPREEPHVLGAMITTPPPDGRYGSLINMQEGGRMIVGIAARGRDAELADDYAGLMKIAERLPHPIAFELMRNAEPVAKVARFGFAASVQRHYEKLERVPERFLCIGDAICSFNPVWGQGMSVAALEVQALARLLDARAGDVDAVASLPKAFYAEAARVIATPWALSVGPDLAYTTTRGDRSADNPAARGFSRALARLARNDASIRELMNDVYNLLEPREALLAPEVLAKVKPLLER